MEGTEHLITEHVCFIESMNDILNKRTIGGYGLRKKCHDIYKID